MMDESIEKLSHELATVSENKLRAYADGDRVLIMVENAPAELRKLADALEKIDIKEVKAMVAYQNPNTRKGGNKPRRLLPEKTS